MKLSTQDEMYTATEGGAFKDAVRLADEVLAGSPELYTRVSALMHACNGSRRLGDSQRIAEYSEALGKASFDLPSDSCLRWEIAMLLDSGSEPPILTGQYEGSADPPPDGDPPWITALPSSMGIDEEILCRVADHCRESGSDGHLVICREKIVSEAYSPVLRNPMSAMSGTKSIAAILFGMLLEEGGICSIDDPVGKYIPSWNKGRRGRVNLKHLLTMTAGFDRIFDERSVGWAKDKNSHVVGLEPQNEPGSRWCYSNEAAQLLSPIMEKAAGEPLQDFARNRLFMPLGLNGTELRLDEAGNAMVYADMRTTLRDYARLGQLVLNKGEWRGRQIVSSEWIREMTMPRHKAYDNQNFSYLWWNPAPGVIAAKGYLENSVYIFPEADLIFARCQRKQHLHITQQFNWANILRLLKEALC